MVKCSALLMCLSIGIVFWMSYEIGLFSHKSVSAAEEVTKPVSEASAKVIEGREAELTRKERDVADKEVVMQEAMKRYEQVVTELHTKAAEQEKTAGQLRAKITELEKVVHSKTSEIETIKAGQTEAFGQIYEKMESKKASKILDEMDVNLATRILSSMKQDKAADVMGKMSAERARSITEKFMTKRSLNSSNKMVNEVKGGESASTSQTKGGE